MAYWAELTSARMTWEGTAQPPTEPIVEIPEADRAVWVYYRRTRFNGANDQSDQLFINGQLLVRDAGILDRLVEFVPRGWNLTDGNPKPKLELEYRTSAGAIKRRSFMPCVCCSWPGARAFTVRNPWGGATELQVIPFRVATDTATDFDDHVRLEVIG